MGRSAAEATKPIGGGEAISGAVLQGQVSRKGLGALMPEQLILGKLGEGSTRPEPTILIGCNQHAGVNPTSIGTLRGDYLGGD